MSDSLLIFVVSVTFIFLLFNELNRTFIGCLCNFDSSFHQLGFISSRERDLSTETIVSEYDVQLEPDSLLCPVDTIWHSLVYLVQHVVVEVNDIITM